MKAWSADFNLHDGVLKTNPLWVRFPNLPLNCWSMKALSKIGSALGKPVYADECTTRSIRISYARMLIEMDVTKPLPRTVKLQDPKGKTILQEITYDWEPAFCAKYLKMGHDCNEVKAPKPQRMIYQRKEAEQSKKNEAVQTSEQGAKTKDNEKQGKEDGWITVIGKSAAKETKAKQNEEQNLVGNNGFQSLRNDQANSDPGTNYMQMRSVGMQELYQVIALVEHRIKEQKTRDVMKKIAPGWQWITNFSTMNRSRIWVIWDPRINVFDPTEIDEQLIHGQLRTVSKLFTIGFTAIYGLHTIKDRQSLWRKLRQIHSTQQGPWLSMGDYNAVLNDQDRQHGSVIQDMETKDFKEFMKDTGMNELQTVGREYTWTNNHTYSRIDKGLVNANWMLTIPSVKIQVLEPCVSDHSPLKLMIIQIQRKNNRPFRFFNCIEDHPQFIQHVEKVWSVDETKGTIQEVWNKLKRVKEVIKGINIQHYQRVEDRIKEARKELQIVQEQMSDRMQQPD
ncbi:PREDICTED: uncharacterized protein LOC109205957 [Nicotiana attenuata]|uniref:uncharacterized protein LOC109205957 n=1 Tax=Nicotiana attenuata TaxID=49451 RepID=UPI000905947D|nr:PREDICTED: uncharacterized protein LOC109205957 [Nicotiana attenuata]